MTLQEIREKYQQFRPWCRAVRRSDGREVEIVSYPYPHQNGAQVMIRETIGDPTSMTAADCENLEVKV